MKKLKEALNRSFGGGFATKTTNRGTEHVIGSVGDVAFQVWRQKWNLDGGSFDIYGDRRVLNQRATAPDRPCVIKTIRAMDAAAMAFDDAMRGEG